MGQFDFPYGHNAVDDQGTQDVSGDVPTYDQACMGLLVCPHCGRAVMCGDLPTEGNNMIRRSGKSSDGGGKRKGTGFPYLSADMLSSTHQLATIVDARVQDDNFRKGEEVVVTKLKLKGQYVLWTLRDTNPCLDICLDAFGADETKWKNREIELFIEEDNFDGKKWIRCEAVAPSKGKKD